MTTLELYLDKHFRKAKDAKMFDRDGDNPKAGQAES